MKPASIYLSRLLLDLRSSQVQAELAHPYEMHRTLMRAFPSAENVAEARREFGVLFRADADVQRRVVKVYVQSLREPDWAWLHHVEGYVMWTARPSPYDCKDATKAFYSIRSGQVLAFRLRANPTKRLAREGDPLKGKRVELQKEQDQIDWLISKGKGGRDGVPGGFELVTMHRLDQEGREHIIPRGQVRSEGKVTGMKRDERGGHTMRHLSVVFEGLLRVTDPEGFLDTLCRGIGSGKAYGFGLLSVAPLQASGAGGTL